MMQRLFSWLRRPPTATPSDERLDYPAWRRQRLVDRANLYPAPKPPIGFSILTAVQNPPPPLLDALAQSIFQQEYPHFEWVIVDNGSNLTTQRRLTQLTRDPRVVLVPSPVNRGIVGGLRLALRSARNEYILPVDHDDELTPDALRVVAASLAALGRPAVAYTDEDKLLPDGTPAHPFFKPDWDPLLFLNCCYTAHLGVMKREAALAVGAYTDEQAQGSPDWDAFSRLVAAGHRPRHIAEIVYSWRMHAGSTAQGGSAAKPYTLAGQYHVLQQHLDRTGLGRHLTIRANPLLGDVGWWRATAGTRRRRRRDDLVILERAVHDDSFRLAVDYLPPGAIVAIQASEATPATADWFQEPLALLDAFPEAVAVGGVLITRRGRLVAGPGVMGMDGLAGWPGRGGRRGDLLGAGTLVHQHRASLVDDRFFLVRGDFLKEMLTDAGPDFAISLLGPWVGATARRLGRTVLFTPYLVGQVRRSTLPEPSADETWRFLRNQWALLLDDPCYSRFLSLQGKSAWELASPADRAAVLNRTLAQLAGVLPYFELLKVDDRRYLHRAIALPEENAGRSAAA